MRRRPKPSTSSPSLHRGAVQTRSLTPRVCSTAGRSRRRSSTKSRPRLSRPRRFKAWCGATPTWRASHRIQRRLFDLLDLARDLNKSSLTTRFQLHGVDARGLVGESELDELGVPVEVGVVSGADVVGLTGGDDFGLAV